MGILGSKEETNQMSIDEYMQKQQNYDTKLQAIYGHQNRQQEIATYQFDGDEDQFYGVNPMQKQQKQMARIQQTSLSAQKNDLFIIKTSLKFVPCGNNQYYLTFIYSSPCNSVLNIWYMAKENQQTNEIESYYKNAKEGRQFVLQAGQQIEFQPNQSIFDLNLVDVKQLKQFELKQDMFSFPIILKIKKMEEDHSFTYYCYIEQQKNGQSLIPHCQCAQLRINGQIFFTQDVFGMNDSILGNKTESEKEPCRICLTNQINTMIKPCQHVILCEECCHNLRLTGQKCPICRTVIQEYVIIEKAQG